MSVSVAIEFKRTGDSEWQRAEYLPEQYFCKDEAPFCVDSIPRFDDIRDYLDASNESLEGVRVLILDEEIDRSKSLDYRFWNNGKNSLVERRDKGPSEEYGEIILSCTQIRNVICLHFILSQPGRLRNAFVP